MNATPPSHEDVCRLAGQHAREVISAGQGEVSGAIFQGHLESFRARWQPVLDDKSYTALYRNYSDWLLGTISNHYQPGSWTPKALVSPESIGDGDEIYRPDAPDQDPEVWQSLLAQTKEMAQSDAVLVASTARTDGGGQAALKVQLDTFIRFAAAAKLNEQQGDALLSLYQQTVNEGLREQLAQGPTKQTPGEQTVSSSGCLGVVVLSVLAPLAALVTWL